MQYHLRMLERGLRRQLKRFHRLARELRMIAGGLLSTGHPILAHLVVTRRCNLACNYCNEYDHTSSPVPLSALEARVDRLAALGTRIVTITGGEPLLQPRLDDVIARIRRRGMLAGLITNGYLLTGDRVQRLNRAGLDHLQISIDNLRPGPVSKKSLKVLDAKLVALARRAEFHVNINSVIGAASGSPEDALVVARRAVELGFSSTVGILHDAWGQVKPLGPAERAVYATVKALTKSSYARFDGFRDNLAEGRANHWRCRAGARYLYICEDGLVHYCSQQRGYPAKPLEQYTAADIRREFLTAKTCAAGCTISCIQQVAYLDAWRAPQQPAAPGDLAPELVRIEGAGR
jgi:MoaA/NifB/PqqE/SkfB family radical SAM enzyme